MLVVFTKLERARDAAALYAFQGYLKSNLDTFGAK